MPNDRVKFAAIALLLAAVGLAPATALAQRETEYERQTREDQQATRDRIDQAARTAKMHDDIAAQYQRENKYPEAISMSDLAKTISPTYIRTVPEKDGWGHEFVYIASPDHLHYRLVSAGSDGVFDYDSKQLVTDAQLASQQRQTADSKEDIIYQDGAFIRYPKEVKTQQ